MKKRIEHLSQEDRTDVLIESGLSEDDAMQVSELLDLYTFPMLDALHAALGKIRKGA